VKSLFQTNGDAGPLLTAEVPGDVEARTAVQAVRKVYPDIRLESQELQYSPRLLYDIVEDVLTERQFTSLQTAYYGGYFETPRKSIGDELAERLGITRQTFNRHLRLAENTVLEQLFEGSERPYADQSARLLRPSVLLSRSNDLEYDTDRQHGPFRLRHDRGDVPRPVRLDER